MFLLRVPLQLEGYGKENKYTSMGWNMPRGSSVKHASIEGREEGQMEPWAHQAKLCERQYLRKLKRFTFSNWDMTLLYRSVLLVFKSPSPLTLTSSQLHSYNDPISSILGQISGNHSSPTLTYTVSTFASLCSHAFVEQNNNNMECRSLPIL